MKSLKVKMSGHEASKIDVGGILKNKLKYKLSCHPSFLRRCASLTAVVETVRILNAVYIGHL